MKRITTKKRKAIIERVHEWALGCDTSVVLIGEDDPHAYAAAIVGVTTDPYPAVVYDYNKLIAELMRINRWGEDTAAEWYSFNTERAFPYYKNPPIVITGIEDVL